MSDENDGNDGSPAGGEAGGDAGTNEQTAESTSRASSEPSGPQQLLDAVGDQIDEVRRRVDDQDTSQPEEDTFIEEGQADEGQPVDDTIAPPG